MPSGRLSFLLSAETEVPSGTEEFLEEGEQRRRRISIEQYVEKFLEERIESQGHLLTPSILEPLIDRLVYFGIFHTIIKDHFAQVKEYEEAHEKRQRFLRLHQRDPDLNDKITEYDAKFLDTCNDLLARQQRCFQELRIPRFKVTNDPREIEVQQLIIDLILYIDPENLYFTTKASGEISF
ncbi:unnamed protein product, partial [Mesorhabditis belari]|uniref:Uncharacterized protein n=1 Tax=Mesorhabditis belari TaxID=2138241 RepID=A0AAF3J980_9BILA